MFSIRKWAIGMMQIKFNATRYIISLFMLTILLVAYVINYEYLLQVSLINKIMVSDKNMVEVTVPNTFILTISNCQMYYQNKTIKYTITKIDLQDKQILLNLNISTKNKPNIFITTCVYGKTTILKEINKFIKEGMIQWKN